MNRDLQSRNHPGCIKKQTLPLFPSGELMQICNLHPRVRDLQSQKISSLHKRKHFRYCPASIESSTHDRLKLSVCSVGLKIHLLRGADYQQQAADEIAALSYKSAPAWDLHQRRAKTADYPLSPGKSSGVVHGFHPKVYFYSTNTKTYASHH